MPPPPLWRMEMLTPWKPYAHVSLPEDQCETNKGAQQRRRRAAGSEQRMSLGMSHDQSMSDI